MDENLTSRKLASKEVMTEMRVKVTGLGIITNFKVEIKQYDKTIIRPLFQKHWE